MPALRHQQDLQQLSIGAGALVFANRAYHGVMATRTEPLDPSASAGTLAGSRSWVPALATGSRRGRVATGVLLAGLAPAGDFTAAVDGKTVARHGAYGWAASWQVHKGAAVISLDVAPLNGVLAAIVLALWFVVLVAVIGIDRFARAAAWLRRRPRPAASTASGTDPDHGADA